MAYIIIIIIIIIGSTEVWTQGLTILDKQYITLIY
jgi:hypothetical protein